MGWITNMDSIERSARKMILEFSLNASAGQAHAAVQTLDSLLVTLRNNEKGKLEIARRLERS